MVRTGTRTPEEVDWAKGVVELAIAATIIERIIHSATRYFSIINIESGFVRGNYYRNKDTYKLTHRPI